VSMKNMESGWNQNFKFQKNNTIYIY
jgi:hypothetical protein